MDIEKLVNSKWYTAFEWFYRLIILNILMILIPSLVGCFPFLYWFINQSRSGLWVILAIILFAFAFIPCYITAFIVIKLYKEGKSENIFKLFFLSLYDTIKRVYIIQLIFFPVILIFIFGASFYWDLLSPDNFQVDTIGVMSIIAFAILFFCLATILLCFVNFPILIAYFQMTTINYLKTTLYMSFKYFFKTLLYLFILLIPIVLLGYLKSLFIPIYLLYGISGPLFFIFLISREQFVYLSNNIDDLKYENKYE